MVSRRNLVEFYIFAGFAVKKIYIHVETSQNDASYKKPKCEDELFFGRQRLLTKGKDDKGSGSITGHKNTCKQEILTCQFSQE